MKKSKKYVEYKNEAQTIDSMPNQSQVDQSLQSQFEEREKVNQKKNESYPGLSPKQTIK